MPKSTPPTRAGTAQSRIAAAWGAFAEQARSNPRFESREARGVLSFR